LARDDGFDAATIARLHCPIGVAGITSKWPAAIAVAVAAQLLQTLPAGEFSRSSDQVICHGAATAAAPLSTLDVCPTRGCATCTHLR
jgi:xanthine dehydrogenase accessory factor